LSTKTGNKASSKTSSANASAEAPARKGKGRKRPAQKIHIRESPKKDSQTMCGGSHSAIWNLSGDRPLQTVSPQQADKATCGRCVRVAKSPKRKVL
jgi:hypothetical protein